MNYSTMKRKGSKAHQSNSERYNSKTQRSYTAPATPLARRDLHTVSTAWLALDSSTRFTKREMVVSEVGGGADEQLGLSDQWNPPLSRTLSKDGDHQGLKC